jgi:hypothetical protein
MANIGFTREVVGTLALLPYLGRGRMDVRDVTSNQIYDILPDNVRVTTGGRDRNNYTYNCRDGIFTILLEHTCVFMLRRNYIYIQNMYLNGAKDYIGMLFHLVYLVMNNWVQNLHDLIYVPWPFDEYGTIYVQSGPKESDPESEMCDSVATSDLITWANEPNWNRDLAYREDKQRTDLNLFRANNVD